MDIIPLTRAPPPPLPSPPRNNISTLHLDNNGLKTVAEDAFHGATHMHNLFMHMNKIRNLDFLVGSSMTRLHVLTLHKNKITAVRDGHFDEYHHLRQLIINNKEVPHVSWIRVAWPCHPTRMKMPASCSEACSAHHHAGGAWVDPSPQNPPTPTCARVSDILPKVMLRS